MAFLHTGKRLLYRLAFEVDYRIDPQEASGESLEERLIRKVARENNWRCSVFESAHGAHDLLARLNRL